MGWKFRKSFSPLPGVRLTLSRSGISTSVGAGPVRLSVGPRGAALTGHIPGTGLSYRHPLSSPAPAPRTHQPRHIPSEPRAPQGFLVPPGPAPAPTPAPSPSLPAFNPFVMHDIKSSGSGALTTPGLAEFRRLLLESMQELKDIRVELEVCTATEGKLVGKYERWRNGWLFRRLFAKTFEALRLESEQATEHRQELQEQEQLAKLATQMELPATVEQAFHRLADEFSKMAGARKIWDTVGARATIQVVERTLAGRTVDRKEVRFKLDKCDLLVSDWRAPRFGNANGGDIFLYPAFAIYFVTADSFALLEYKDIQLEFAAVRFHEQQGVPPDSEVVGTTWHKTNKDGSPDRRFKDNFSIPVAQYGQFVLKSNTGMNEEYMVSNFRATAEFAQAFDAFRAAVAIGG